MISPHQSGRGGRLELVSITKQYRTSQTILRDISIEVPDGEITALVGRSGVGKTTLLNLIAGFLRPDSGDVRFDGEPVTGPGGGKVMIFQGDALFPWFTVRGNIEFAVQNGSPKDKHLPGIDSLLARVRLESHADRFPGELSGGMQKRVEVLRAFAALPRLLLADEPFRGNDDLTRWDLVDMLLEHWLCHRPTVLIATHDIEEAIFLANRVIVLNGAPATIGQDFNIPFPYPRARSLRFDPAFQGIRAEVLASLGD
jgi:NitT/TauT family transport system ATP-binding protein